MAKAPKEILLEQERFELKPKSGGGLLSYEVWGYREQGKTVVTRYNLAYINHAIYRGDNGRVLGFDNAHGYPRFPSPFCLSSADCAVAAKDLGPSGIRD